MSFLVFSFLLVVTVAGIRDNMLGDEGNEVPWLIGKTLDHWGWAKNKVIDMIVSGRTDPDRTPIMETPDKYGMDFQQVDISAIDDVRLSAWEIEAESDKLLIINHPLETNRWGTPKGFDGVPVNFMPMLNELHNAGFNIITYDQRGQGTSDGGVGANRVGKEAVVGVGSEEWKDFLGVLKYVRAHEKFSEMKIGIVSQCMGAVASFDAWKRADELQQQELFSNVKVHVAIQPTISYSMTRRITVAKVGIDLADEVQEAQRKKVGFGFPNSLDTVGSVKVPMFFLQLKGDYTQEDEGVNDVQLIADAVDPSVDKEILWIGRSTDHPWGEKNLRFEAYNYFGEHPKELIEHLNKYL